VKATIGKANFLEMLAGESPSYRLETNENNPKWTKAYRDNLTNQNWPLLKRLLTRLTTLDFRFCIQELILSDEK